MFSTAGAPPVNSSLKSELKVSKSLFIPRKSSTGYFAAPTSVGFVTVEVATCKKVELSPPHEQ